MKTLYFEGAGCVPRGNVPNCRIRTAFHLDNGSAVYLEIEGHEVTKYSSPRVKHLVNGAAIMHCHTITGSTDDGNAGRLPCERSVTFEYTLENILQFVNSLGASFDAVEVLPDLAGYRVHAGRENGINRYNYGDAFPYDPEQTRARVALHDHIYQLEKQRGERFQCFSLWVDPEDPALLHFRNYRGDHYSADGTLEELAAHFNR